MRSIFLLSYYVCISSNTFPIIQTTFSEGMKKEMVLSFIKINIFWNSIHKFVETDFYVNQLFMYPESEDVDPEKLEITFFYLINFQLVLMKKLHEVYVVRSKTIVSEMVSLSKEFAKAALNYEKEANIFQTLKKSFQKKKYLVEFQNKCTDFLCKNFYLNEKSRFFYKKIFHKLLFRSYYSTNDNTLNKHNVIETKFNENYTMYQSLIEVMKTWQKSNKKSQKYIIFTGGFIHILYEAFQTLDSEKIFQIIASDNTTTKKYQKIINNTISIYLDEKKAFIKNFLAHFELSNHVEIEIAEFNIKTTEDPHYSQLMNFFEPFTKKFLEIPIFVVSKTKSGKSFPNYEFEYTKSKAKEESVAKSILFKKGGVLLFSFNSFCYYHNLLFVSKDKVELTNSDLDFCIDLTFPDNTYYNKTVQCFGNRNCKHGKYNFISTNFSNKRIEIFTRVIFNMVILQFLRSLDIKVFVCVFLAHKLEKKTDSPLESEDRKLVLLSQELFKTIEGFSDSTFHNIYMKFIMVAQLLNLKSFSLFRFIEKLWENSSHDCYDFNRNFQCRYIFNISFMASKALATSLLVCFENQNEFIRGLYRLNSYINKSPRSEFSYFTFLEITNQKQKKVEIFISAINYSKNIKNSTENTQDENIYPKIREDSKIRNKNHCLDTYNKNDVSSYLCGMNKNNEGTSYLSDEDSKNTNVKIYKYIMKNLDCFLLEFDSIELESLTSSDRTHLESKNIVKIDSNMIDCSTNKCSVDTLFNSKLALEKSLNKIESNMKSSAVKIKIESVKNHTQFKPNSKSIIENQNTLSHTHSISEEKNLKNPNEKSFLQNIKEVSKIDNGCVNFFTDQIISDVHIENEIIPISEQNIYLVKQKGYKKIKETNSTHDLKNICSFQKKSKRIFTNNKSEEIESSKNVLMISNVSLCETEENKPQNCTQNENIQVSDQKSLVDSFDSIPSYNIDVFSDHNIKKITDEKIGGDNEKIIDKNFNIKILKQDRCHLIDPYPIKNFKNKIIKEQKSILTDSNEHNKNLDGNIKATPSKKYAQKKRYRKNKTNTAKSHKELLDPVEVVENVTLDLNNKDCKTNCDNQDTLIFENDLLIKKQNNNSHYQIRKQGLIKTVIKNPEDTENLKANSCQSQARHGDQQMLKEISVEPINKFKYKDEQIGVHVTDIESNLANHMEEDDGFQIVERKKNKRRIIDTIIDKNNLIIEPKVLKNSICSNKKTESRFPSKLNSVFIKKTEKGIKNIMQDEKSKKGKQISLKATNIHSADIFSDNDNPLNRLINISEHNSPNNPDLVVSKFDQKPKSTLILDSSSGEFSISEINGIYFSSENNNLGYNCEFDDYSKNNQDHDQRDTNHNDYIEAKNPSDNNIGTQQTHSILELKNTSSRDAKLLNSISNQKSLGLAQEINRYISQFKSLLDELESSIGVNSNSLSICNNEEYTENTVLNEIYTLRDQNNIDVLDQSIHDHLDDPIITFECDKKNFVDSQKATSKIILSETSPQQIKNYNCHGENHLNSKPNDTIENLDKDFFIPMPSNNTFDQNFNTKIQINVSDVQSSSKINQLSHCNELLNKFLDLHERNAQINAVKDSKAKSADLKGIDVFQTLSVLKENKLNINDEKSNKPISKEEIDKSIEKNIDDNVIEPSKSCKINLNFFTDNNTTHQRTKYNDVPHKLHTKSPVSLNILSRSKYNSGLRKSYANYDSKKNPYNLKNYQKIHSCPHFSYKTNDRSHNIAQGRYRNQFIRNRNFYNNIKNRFQTRSNVVDSTMSINCCKKSGSVGNTKQPKSNYLNSHSLPSSNHQIRYPVSAHQPCYSENQFENTTKKNSEVTPKVLTVSQPELYVFPINVIHTQMMSDFSYENFFETSSLVATRETIERFNGGLSSLILGRGVFLDAYLGATFFAYHVLEEIPYNQENPWKNPFTDN